MSSSSFQMSNFVPIDGKLVMMGEMQVTFSFSSVYNTGIHVDLWSEDDNGFAYQQSKDTLTDGSNEPALSFDNFPTSVDLHYRITVTGEDGSENTVYVRIDW